VFAAMKKTRPRKLQTAWLQASRVCVALGDPHRQRILLLFEPGERLAMQQILQTTTLSRTAVTHHLRVMRDAGVLVSEKIGKEVFYSIDKAYVRDQLAAIVDYIDGEL
jgi:DNA-binding transcriptional ArsR family regulator